MSVVKRARWIGIGIVLGAIALVFAGTPPTKTGNLEVTGSATVSGSAWVAGGVYQAGNQVVSVVGSALFKSGPEIWLASCGIGQVWLYDGSGIGSGWNCGSQGAFYTGSAGVAINGSDVITADLTFVQKLITGTCSSPNAIRAIGSDGTVTCTTGVSTLTNGAGAGVVPVSDGTNFVASSLTDTGTATTATDLLYSSLTPTALASGRTDNWAPGNQSLIIVTPDTGGSQISSMVADANCGTPKAGAIRTICDANLSHGEVTFQGYDCGNGTASNRFYFPTNNCNGFVLGHRQCAQFVYSCESSKWMLVGNPGLEGEIGFQMQGAGSAADVSLGATVNDYTPTGWYQYTQYRIAAASATTITGMAGLPDSGGNVSKVRCFSTFSAITFAHNSGSSLAGNRFLLPNSANLEIPTYGNVCFRYDNPNTAWMVAYASPTPFGAVTSTSNTSTDLAVFGAGNTITNYGGASSCSAGSFFTGLSAAGASTCSAALTASNLSGTTGTLLKTTGTNTGGDSGLVESGNVLYTFDKLEMRDGLNDADFRLIATGGVNYIEAGSNSGTSAGELKFTSLNASTTYGYFDATGNFFEPNNQTFGTNSANTVTMLGTLTINASGATVTSGSGGPGATCTTGSLYLNTAGGTSTTLYVCTSTNTWTAK